MTTQVIVNLQNIEGRGDFPCPKCGQILDPESESDNEYRIIDEKVEHDKIIDLTIRCLKCGQVIILTGFNS